MTDDVRDHPEYEKGYNDRWHGRGVKSTSPEYMAGYAAAQHARNLFSEAGFSETAPGLFTKSGTIDGSHG